MIHNALLVGKILVIGAITLGKPSAIQPFVNNTFNPMVKSTIGVDFALKEVEVTIGTTHPAIEHVVLQLWDLAGEHKYQSILPYYIAGTQGIIFAFDCTQPKTLTILAEYIANINIYIDVKQLPTILMSTKHDLTATIQTEDIQEYRQKYAIQDYYSTSALTGFNIDTVFQRVGQLLADKIISTG